MQLRQEREQVLGADNSFTAKDGDPANGTLELGDVPRPPIVTKETVRIVAERKCGAAEGDGACLGEHRDEWFEVVWSFAQ